METPGVPPGLAQLLDETANRSVSAYNAVRRELEGLREDVRVDRRRDDERFAALDVRIGELREAFAGELTELAGELAVIKRNSAALVVTDEDPVTGETTVHARKFGVDGATLLGAAITLVISGIVPVLLVILK
jgi:hypothetical protein